MLFPSTACLLQRKIGAAQRLGVRPRRRLLGVHLRADHGGAARRQRAPTITRSSSAPTSCRASSTTPIARRACCSATAPAPWSCRRRRIATLGIIDFENYIDGSGGPALCMPAGGSLQPASHETVDERLHYVKQDGQTVFKFAVRKTEEICRRLLERNGLSRRRHRPASCRTRPTSRIILSAAEKLGLAEREGRHQHRAVSATPRRRRFRSR